MVHDIRNDIDGLRTEPLLICENARSLENISPLDIDTVITSPPYVNGTNYFRNTKIELWFLRCLKEKKDLARFREAALTAGINDVTVSKTPTLSHPDVQKIVSKLEQNAYDSRIPRMIASYFSEITEVFRAICPHLTPSATVAIDIGDSCYAGIHVPVDELLSTCLQELDFVPEDSVTLRERKSRGGMLLKQSLLVFKYTSQQEGKTSKKTNRELACWMGYIQTKSTSSENSLYKKELGTFPTLIMFLPRQTETCYCTSLSTNICSKRWMRVRSIHGCWHNPF